ncbi:MAG: hypothetical protein IPK85_26815 [Gemmatimonadetes bacterium]|nr:hypothetical protein [Gemmatimonadota bacterium]
MTTAVLVARWRSRLAGIGVVSALLYGVGALAVTLRAAGWLGGSRAQGWALAAMVGLAVTVWRGWRAGLGRLDPQRVGLWLEEREPTLHYAVLGALAGSAVCDARVHRSPVGTAAWRWAGRALLRAFGAAGLGVASYAGTPTRAPDVGPNAQRLRVPEGVTSLGAVRVRVVPPAYARRPAEEFTAPDVLHPLVGSRLELSGEGPAPGVRADTQAVAATRRGTGWVASYIADTLPALVTVSRDGDAFLLAVDPVRDALPQVALELPARDTVVRAVPASLAVRATFQDDLRLDSTRFEYIVTSGDGERFTFRRGELDAQAEQGPRAMRTMRWDLAALALLPGDVVHLRALARDSRGQEGASDTRALRVARPGEADSLAVDAAPPPEVEASVLSQRMLINLAEALVRRERGMAPSALRTESVRIGRDQARLRRQVSDLIFARLGDDPAGEHFHGDGHEHGAEPTLRRALTPEELLQAADRATGARGALVEAAHDEAPLVAVSRPLLEAYNAMWDAGRELESGAPRAALPSMYAALAAIQKARAAERLYLRGATRAVVVDLARVRLAGRDRGLDHVREAQAPLAPPGQALWQRVVGAVARPGAGEAVDSLLVLRVASAGNAPVAAALDSLVAGIRAGRDVTMAVVVVRERLGGAGAARPPTGWRPIP